MISMKHIFQRGRYEQIYNFGLKIVILGPFQSLPLPGEKILTLQTWLKKYLVLSSWGHVAKLA